MAKKQVFMVTDVETCVPKEHDRFAGLVFDLAWKAIDRKGKVYGQASYALTDALSLEKPYFWEKVGRYLQYCYDRDIVPAKFEVVRKEYNDLVGDLISDGCQVIIAAYNARFDCEALQYTTTRLAGEGEKFMQHPVDLLDIWYYWAVGCPMKYTAPTTASGKFLSTTAESVWAFENNDPDFVEEHIAFGDVDIEAQILLKVLKRKHKLPLVKTVGEFAGSVYRVANKRLGIDGRTILPNHIPQAA